MCVCRFPKPSVQNTLLQYTFNIVALGVRLPIAFRLLEGANEEPLYVLGTPDFFADVSGVAEPQVDIAHGPPIVTVCTTKDALATGLVEH